MNITNEIKVFRSIRIFVLSLLIVLSFSSSYINQTEEEIQEERTEEIIEEFIIQGQHQQKKFHPLKESFNYTEFIDIDNCSLTTICKPFTTLKLYIKYCQLALDKKLSESLLTINNYLNPKSKHYEGIRKNHIQPISGVFSVVRGCLFNSSYCSSSSLRQKNILETKNFTTMKSINNIINNPTTISFAWFGSLFMLAILIH